MYIYLFEFMLPTIVNCEWICVFTGLLLQASKFSMTCYRGDGDEASGASDALSFPARVVRGESVSCYVKTTLWDTRLQLIITDCRFTTPFNANLSTLTYHFINNKCVPYLHYSLVIFTIPAKRIWCHC